ncbi:MULTISPECIES: DUF2795 domain-containing protein [Ktedonobacter]|uniref:DUF2795 domain-containing protein n=1 Tax=Ktedonobacter robiniae TaxID=2778365 RepID=A0ABQ3UGG6_9CHLR|nr:MULTISPECIES: DUF2795 domain-containing protein [Ktedonobacter]GHO51802.1 hypothetical protein KSB_02770 [Ktedonobacter robiniae]GHO65220.1 hypothetical protein KSC_041120 [Ktedonobacter sp. SOSP1-52]
MSQQPANPVQVEKCLKGMDYPADKQEVINYAKQHGADEQVQQTLNRLPNETFNKPTDVSKAIGEMDRGQR